MKTIIFLFLFSFSTISSVQARSGNEWLSQCESTELDLQIECIVYLEGLRDMHKHYDKTLFQNEGVQYQICYPTNMTNGIVVKIMKKFLNENPELLHFTFTSLFLNKMMMTFPCNKQDKK